MKWVCGLVLGLALGHAPLCAKELPYFRRNGQATQLMVDGQPYIALGGELHNSSPSSPAYMAPIWDSLKRRNVRTVIGAASWELVEPREGVYDFTAVDDQIVQARAHGIRLVMIWFGAYKNAESKYAPSWVRRDEKRFPRAERASTTRIGGFFTTMLSVFNERLVEADSRAFAALMRHIRQVDPDQTVIMVQVENEVGLMGDSRDRSRSADAAWNQQVPADLMTYLARHRAALRPALLEIWQRNGFRTGGTWGQVFGADARAEEIFMAWAFGRYVERIAKAGAAEYALPMYANAWLGPQPGYEVPGDYPTGGPVARMMDVWKAAAPSLALLAPDIYVDDFAGVLADYRRPDNPIFIPEAKFDVGNMFVALGRYGAIAFAPFGIESRADDNEVFQAYAALTGMTSIIARGQSEGRVRGFKLAKGAIAKDRLSGYDLEVGGPGSTIGAFGAGTGSAAVMTDGYGMVIQRGENEFLIVGRGISVKFGVPGKQVEVDAAQEGAFAEGRWVPGRTLNGDERFSLLPADAIRIVHVTLMTR